MHSGSRTREWPSEAPECSVAITWAASKRNIRIPTVRCAGHVPLKSHGAVWASWLLVVCGQGRGQGCGCGLQRAGHNTQTISTNHPHITAPRDCRYITEKTLWYWDSNLKSQSHVGCVISLNSHLSLSLISHWSMVTATYVHSFPTVQCSLSINHMPSACFVASSSAHQSPATWWRWPAPWLFTRPQLGRYQGKISPPAPHTGHQS